MKIVALDFETYFDMEYSLKKLTTEAYIRDARFETLGCGIRYSDGALKYYEGRQVKQILRAINWQETACLCHHAQFDGFILSHHYGVSPSFWFDTIPMARLILGNTVSAALGFLAQRYGLAEKSVPYNEFVGKHLADMSAELRAKLAEGCIHDVELMWAIFKKLMPQMPPEELRGVDMTTRMFTEPQLIGNTSLFNTVARDEFESRAFQLDRLGVSAGDLRSDDKFAAILTEAGVEVEYKNGKNGPIPAFAKTDNFMQDLVASPDEGIAAIAEARLSASSSIDETRAARLRDMSMRGPMPIYLAAFAAATTRWGGGDKVNWQNLRRGGQLRKGIEAPPGYKLGVVDKSQIEFRLLMEVAGQRDVVEELRRGDDPYLGIASQFYRRPITKADKPERGLGKQLKLSCGYGAGGSSIVATAKRGTYGPPIVLTDDEGLEARNLYRRLHPTVPALWSDGDDVILPALAEGNKKFIWRDVLEINGNRIYGPNGSFMVYHVEWSDVWQSWVRHTRYGRKRIWGGVLTQNLMEFLARINMTQDFITLWREGIRVVCTVHDEGWFLHPELGAQAAHERVIRQFSTPPKWLPGCPLAAEGELGDRYEK